jgi:WD40 repeat protein
VRARRHHRTTPIDGVVDVTRRRRTEIHTRALRHCCQISTAQVPRRIGADTEGCASRPAYYYEAVRAGSPAHRTTTSPSTQPSTSPDDDARRSTHGHSGTAVRSPSPLPRCHATLEQALRAHHRSTVRLWDVASLECVRVMHGHRGCVTCVSGGIADGGDRVLVASGSGDGHGRVRLWDVRTGECVRRELSGHSIVMSVSSSSIDVGDGRRLLASGSNDGSMRLWDVASGECVGVVSVPGGAVKAVGGGFGVGGSNDRVLVATGSGDGVVRVWDVRSILRSQSSRGSDRGVTVPCVSNSFIDVVSGRYVVASLGRHGSVALWDANSCECVRVMTEPGGVWIL